ncbi:MAG: hypothetical protein R3B07_35550 [Polyangiaceae bacterium]
MNNLARPTPHTPRNTDCTYRAVIFRSLPVASVLALAISTQVACGDTSGAGENASGGVGGSGGTAGVGGGGTAGSGLGGSDIGGSAGVSGSGGEVITAAACPAAATSAPPSVGHCNADGFCFENPIPLSTIVHGVFGVSADDVWATGEDNAILHYDGSTWSVRDFGFRGVSMNGAWGASSNDVWLVGGFYSNYGYLQHWDGSQLSETSLTDAALLAVHGISAGDIWAVGKSGAVKHYDGAAWRPVTTPATTDLYGVRAFGSDVFIGGKGTFFRLNGAGSSNIQIPADTDVVSLWGTSADDVFVGAATSADGALLHWDGSTLSELGRTTSPITSVSGAGAGDVWVATKLGQTLHYDGASLAPRGDLGDRVSALWVAGANDVFAATDAAVVPVRGDGASFSTTTPVLADLKAVWGASMDDVWVGGEDGTLLHLKGSSWTTASSPTGSDIIGLWGTAKNAIWLADATGQIFRFDGNQWQSEATYDEGFYRLFGTGSTLWFITNFFDGDVVSYTNGQFRRLPAPPFPPEAIWASADNNVWISGNHSVARFDGVSWTETHLDNIGDFDAIWGRGPNDIWVSGFISDGYHFDGNTWTREYRADSAATIWGCGSEDVWFDDYPRVTHLSGDDWKTSDAEFFVNGFLATGSNVLTIGPRGGITRHREL